MQINLKFYEFVHPLRVFVLNRTLHKCFRYLLLCRSRLSYFLAACGRFHLWWLISTILYGEKDKHTHTYIHITIHIYSFTRKNKCSYFINANVKEWKKKQKEMVQYNVVTITMMSMTMTTAKSHTNKGEKLRQKNT